MADDPFTKLGIQRGSSREEVKKAYRKLCLTCHPDVRPDKEAATIEFRELTRVYRVALTMVGTARVQNPPKPPPPKPPHPITAKWRLASVDLFEIQFFGEILRDARAPPEMFVYGGTMEIEIRSMASYENPTFFSFIVPPNTKNAQKFRFNLSIGIMELTLVSQNK